MRNKSASGRADRPMMYEIIVEGALDRRWQEWFGGMSVTVLAEDSPFPHTVMTGKVRDRSALYGILCQIMNYNLPIISVKRLDKKGGELSRTGNRQTIIHNKLK